MKSILIILSVLTLSFSQEKQLYTCGMHPNVIKEEMGTCPICEMDLTPIKQDVASDKAERKILYWRAPMNPNEIYNKAGKSAMGMDLVPVYSDEVEGATVKISPALQQNMGVRFATAEKRALIKEIRTTGAIQFDESRVSHISFKYDVWVEHSPINFVGQKVKKGETLLSVYSPELVSAQQEYLTAIQSSKLLGEAGKELIESAKLRLKMWDVPEQTIAEIKQRGKALRVVKIKSPASGVITMLKAKHGHFAKKGEMLIEIADLSKVWLIMDIYEKDLTFVKVGQDVFVTLPYNPKAEFAGKIDYIYPVLDAKTRSAKARVILHNPNERLKVNMLADAKIASEQGGDILAVPSEAVIRTGNRNLVILKGEKNNFIPRNIELGHYFKGFYEIRAGLLEGDEIVTSAQFLIDSESKLKEAIQKMISEKKAEQASSMRSEASIAEISLPSIQCDICVETITEALNKSALVSSVQIDLEKKLAHVGFDAEKASQVDIEKLIAESGYNANMTKRNAAAYAELPACCKED
jgi:Cu(I)/Ag(I) efflux system membrane fusion protein/cobalt-zinc-cadmium efflux system membrane fusion protein